MKMNRLLANYGHLALVALTLALVAGCSSAKQDNRIKITRLEDLPQHTYPVEGDVLDLLESRERILALAEQVRSDVEEDQATYRVEDKTTLKRWEGTLLSVDLLEGNDDVARERIERLRELEDKESTRLTKGLATSAILDAAEQVDPDEDFNAYQAAYRKELSERLARLPWDVVEDEVQREKGRTEIFSENLLKGSIQARLTPVVARTGELNAEQAATLLSVRYAIENRMPLKQATVDAYQEYIAANKKTKPNIWPQRDLALGKTQPYSEVLVAAWDSGTDPEIFAGRLYQNDMELPNGSDDDGNGFIDDIHGVAYEIDAGRSFGDLYPLGPAAGNIDGAMLHMKGFMDIQADVDSEEASALKRHLASLEQSKVPTFIENLNLAGNYAHGTHVAGIMLEGNPFANLLIARHSYDYHLVPIARTYAWGKRDAAKCRDTVAYMKDHDVRVVNMSWGEARQDAEDSLDANGIGDSAEERRELARKVFNLQKEGLYDAIKNAPDILFVCAAGNSDNDVAFDEYIPSSFDLPNLITVGAVDQAGDPTSFTSFGPTVQVYANGFEVESYVPGGKRMKMSGTSMASPNVANLAGKLLAMDPDLKPKEVIELIRAGCDKKKYGEHNYLLLNPKRSGEMLSKRLARKH